MPVVKHTALILVHTGSPPWELLLKTWTRLHVTAYCDEGTVTDEEARPKRVSAVGGRLPSSCHTPMQASVPLQLRNFKCVLPELHLLKQRDFAFWKRGREKYLSTYGEEKEQDSNKSRLSKGQRNKTHAGKERGDWRVQVGVWEAWKALVWSPEGKSCWVVREVARAEELETGKQKQQWRRFKIDFFI